MIRKILRAGLILFALSASAAENEQAVQQHEAYSDAQVLGRCAGFLSFMSQLYAAQNQLIQANDAALKSNGWRIATMGALLAAGWRSENLARTADSIYEGAITSWRVRLEGADPDLSSSLDEESKFCLSHNQSQEIYREFLKRVANQTEN